MRGRWQVAGADDTVSERKRRRLKSNLAIAIGLVGTVILWTVPAHGHGDSVSTLSSSLLSLGVDRPTSAGVGTRRTAGVPIGAGLVCWAGAVEATSAKQATAHTRANRVKGIWIRG